MNGSKALFAKYVKGYLQNMFGVGPTYRDEEWEHGLRCGECHELFRDGQPYAEQFAGLIEDVPVVTPVCVPCGLATPVRPDDE